ncbi:hypothetical protein HG536_0F03980 [Torulaspora globosa]|uniref:Uncharacterized protein n=1 Tax=Torulaspora globosa TaxID=48254 RepID=A0A7G3ZKN7_9SACH|nr:uncharacterized protein HG536_0F03980 [Torulaspora globosa]QLL34073.1 hypothetical protein HG536_0F03980 [Torulaspora globosa]
MNLLIDRMENPGQRKSAPLVPSVRATAVPMREMTSGREKERQQRQRQVNIDLPTISVNDKPIASGKTAQRRTSFGRKDSLNRNEDKEPHYDRAAFSYHHGRRSSAGADVTSASAGMFSECMFKSESQRPMRHSSTSTTACSPASSVSLGKKGHVETSLEPLKRHHRHHEHPSSGAYRRHRSSFVSVGLNDNKRLVNEFLRSTRPAGAESHMFQEASRSLQTSAEGITPERAVKQRPEFEGYASGSHRSLQSLLYHDLTSNNLAEGTAPMVPPQPFLLSSTSSSSNSSSLSVVHADQRSSPSLSAYDSEDSFNFEKWDMNGSGLTINGGISLNYNEADFYRRHIEAELHKFEDTLKHNLKETIVKNEIDMQQNWKAFDVLIAQLDKLKNDAQSLHDSVKDSKLVTLQKDFDQNDEKSFISNVTASIRVNATQLKSLEARMDCCKRKLLQQRDTLRKLEGLLSLEDSLLNAKATSKLAYKYRYMVFDAGVFIGVVLVFFFVKWFIWC